LKDKLDCPPTPQMMKLFMQLVAEAMKNGIKPPPMA
jgi:hypothetical protein